MVRDRTNITIAIRYEIRYFPSNGVNAKVIRRDLDLYFQGHKMSENHNI